MTKREANQLARHLPKGYLALAQARLAREGRTCSIGYISRVKTGNEQNESVEAVLIALAAAEKERRAKHAELLASVTNS